LGINDSVLRLLEESASGGYRAKIGSRLKDAANKLQARQKIIYNRYTILCEPFRLIHESVLLKALSAIEEAIVEADRLRQEIIDAYEEEYTAFLEWANLVLVEANLEPDVIEAALIQYADIYPSKEDILEKALQILVERPVKIPSLIEESQIQARQNQQKAELQERENERQKLMLLQRSQDTLQQTLLSTLYDAQVRSKDEANAKLAELLESFRLKGENASDRTGQKWTTIIDRLQVLTQYENNLQPFVEKAQQLQQLYLERSPNLEILSQHLEDFRLMLKERVKQQHSNSAGLADLTKALALDEGYSELLSSLDEISLNPNPEKLHELKGKLASMSNLFKFRTKDLQQRWQNAENSVRKYLGEPGKQIIERSSSNPNSSIENIEEDETDARPTKPYDPIAGF
jgi:hypothetical protein